METDVPEGSRNRLTVDAQVAQTRQEFGDALDPGVLTLTLTMYRAMAAFDRAHLAELSPHRLTLSQFNVLSVLHRAAQPLTMSELSAAVSVRPASLTAVVETLVRRQFLERRLNEGDRRSLLVANTNKGEDFLAAILPGHWQFLQRLTAGLTARQRRSLTRLLEGLRDSVQKADVDGSPKASTAAGRAEPVTDRRMPR